MGGQVGGQVDGWVGGQVVGGAGRCFGVDRRFCVVDVWAGKGSLCDRVHERALFQAVEGPALLRYPKPVRFLSSPPCFSPTTRASRKTPSSQCLTHRPPSQAASLAYLPTHLTTDTAHLPNINAKRIFYIRSNQ